jgi:hypothetical protein|eukprot:scaffold5914_cov210-Alexandrium_tamarense.AAC.2
MIAHVLECWAVLSSHEESLWAKGPDKQLLGRDAPNGRHRMSFTGGSCNLAGDSGNDAFVCKEKGISRELTRAPAIGINFWR